MSLDVNISEPDEFNCYELHTCIKEIANLKNVENFTYHVDYVCGKGENFIANVFRVTIKESEQNDKTFSAIVKTLINTTRQELFHELHKREVYVYENVIKKFVDLQRLITEDKRLILPKCLYSRVEKRNEIIILEDLKEKGFEIDSRLAGFERLEYHQVKAVLKNLAKFHALSFIYEKHDPESFAKVKSKFQDIIFSNNFLNKSKLRNYFHDSFETSLHLVESSDARNKLERVHPQILEILQQYTQPGVRNVLCHGDCWINNVMFHNENTEEIQVCFIDFQAMRYASPATDILHFLYLCTDSAFRSAYLKDLLNDYYDSLESFLKLYDIETNLVYPREDFDSDINYTLPFGFLIALLEMKLVTTEVEHTVASKTVPADDEDVHKERSENGYYKVRVNDVIKESIDNGVLEKLTLKINV